MIDTLRGVLRVRKWPKKRGTPRSALQRWWIDWFRQANILAKYVDGASQARAIAMTKGSGLYPRDVLLKAMRGRLYHFVDQDGNKWFPMAGIQDISDTLDMLAQNIGSVLVRAVDRWRAPDPGNLNDVLTYKGIAAPPVWQAPSAGGLVTEELAESPISPDNSVNFYNFDVSAYAEVQFIFQDIATASPDSLHVRFSIDNGVTYRSGGSDYRALRFSPGADHNTSRSTLELYDTSTAAARNGLARVGSLRVARAFLNGAIGPSNSVMFCSGFARFDGPVTNVRFMSGAGSNFDAGTIFAVGYLA